MTEIMNKVPKVIRKQSKAETRECLEDEVFAFNCHFSLTSH